MADELPQSPASAPIAAEALVRRMLSVRREERGGCTYWALWTATPLAAGYGLFLLLTNTEWMRAVPPLALAAVLAAVVTRMKRLISAAWSLRAALALRDVPASGADALVELLRWPDKRVEEAARAWLTAVLPGLTEEDAAALLVTHRARLFDALTFWEAVRHPSFVSAILKALPRVADEQVLPALRRLQRLPALTPTLAAIRQEALATTAAVERRLYQLRLATKAAEGAHAENVPDDVARRRGYAGFGEELGVRPQMRLGFLVAAWLVILPFSLVRGIRCLSEGAWAEAMACGVLAVAASQLHRITLLGKHRRLARRILEESDVMAVGKVAEATVWPDARVRAAAYLSLTRLLPQLTTDHSGVLTTAQRQCLYALLNRAMARDHPELVIAVVRALEQIGDVAAIRYVRELANMKETSARLAAVRQNAEHCLPVLLERARQNTDPQVLLRPAEAAGPPEEMLLRPVQPGECGEDGLLVRPAEPPAG